MAKRNSSGSHMSPSTIHDMGPVISKAPQGDMIIRRSKVKVEQPTPAQIQEMMDREFIRKNPTTSA